MSAAHLPFAGLKVVDLSHFWSGPYMTMYLGAYGADVIKVESPQRPDAWRYNHTAPSLGSRWFDRGLLWQACNLDKRDLTLDLNQPEAQELLLRLCADADVFVENFSTKVLARFGISYERLKEVNPAIIMMRLPGFGLEGPWQDYVGWGDAFEQIAGLTLVTGYPDGRPQIPGGYMDPIVGMHATAALLAALDHRERTGEGQLVEVPQIEVGVSMSAGMIISAELGDKLGREGNRTPGYAPQGVYRCADQAEEYLALSVRDDGEWSALLELMGQPEALQPLAGADLAGRHAAHDAIDEALQRWLEALPVAQAEALLLGAGIPAARLLRPVRYGEEPQLAARDYYQELVHPLSGPRLFPTFPMHYSFETDHAVYRAPAPMLGQHNGEVLAELGLGAEEIASLAERRIIASEQLSGAG